MALNAKQECFVAQYLVDLNATQAAIRAGYSKATANRIGSRLLTNVDIAAAIQAGKARQLEKAELSSTRVLEEARRLAFSDIGAMFDDEGRLKPLKDIPRESRSALASVKATKKNLTAGDGVTEDVVEIKLWDKTKALHDLMQHFGLLIEKVEHSGGIELGWMDSE